MSFEKYGNKLIKLLKNLEKRIESTPQFGGSDGLEGKVRNSISGEESKIDSYTKVLSYSVNHASVLVHLDGNTANTVSDLERPQIEYKKGGEEVREYSTEQQLRLGCDNVGNMYNFSTVLTYKFKKTRQSDTKNERFIQM